MGADGSATLSTATPICLTPAHFCPFCSEHTKHPRPGMCAGRARARGGCVIKPHVHFPKCQRRAGWCLALPIAECAPGARRRGRLAFPPGVPIRIRCRFGAGGRFLLLLQWLHAVAAQLSWPSGPHLQYGTICCSAWLYAIGHTCSRSILRVLVSTSH